MDFEEKTPEKEEKENQVSEEVLNDIANQLKKSYTEYIEKRRKKREEEKPKVTKWMTRQKRGYLGFVNVLENKGEKSLVEIPISCKPELTKEEREFEVLNKNLEDM